MGGSENIVSKKKARDDFINMIIMKYVKFKICYLFLLWGIVLCILFGCLLASKVIPHTLLKSPSFFIFNIIGLFVGFYINLGFVKYSFIVNAEKFRKIITIIIGLLFINFIVSFFKTVLNLEASYMPHYFSLSGALMSLLFFFAFKLVQHCEVKFFPRLSRLNLYSFIFELISLPVTLSVKYFSAPKFIYILSFPQCIISILILYWEIKLFRYLYFQYEKPPTSANTA